MHRGTQKNHALKLVSRGGRLRVTKVLDTMQVWLGLGLGLALTRISANTN